MQRVCKACALMLESARKADAVSVQGACKGCAMLWVCNAVGVQSGGCAMPVVSKGEAMSVQGMFSARLGVQCSGCAGRVWACKGRARHLWVCNASSV